MKNHQAVRYGIWLLLFAATCVPSWAVGEKPTKKPALAETGPRPDHVPTPKPETIEKSISRGVDFLLARQNTDGSWGSARNTKGLNIYAPVPGAHHAFRSAVTSLCVSALIETGSDRADVTEAIDRGEKWLFEHLPKLRRATEDAIYNSWGHAYSIQALVRIHNRHGDDEKLQALAKWNLKQQIELLERYECVDGGWCYYDFEIGMEIPDRLVERAMESIRRQRKPDFSYCYGEYLKYAPMHPVNRPGGSLGRSQSCNLAMRLWGDDTVTDKIVVTWLDRLFARNLWLDIGRKRPIPHESWFSVAGYFFYYGHYYAGLCIEQLEPSERGRHQDQLAQVLLRLQEKDGCWWDYPFYDYHQQYGTAYAIMSLVRCRRDSAD